jgi:hypothetical protein
VKTLPVIFLIIFGFNTANAQYSIRASMGIDLANTPSLNDYINQTFPVGSEPVDDFNTAINFSGEFDYAFTNTFQAGLEVSYIFTSYTFIDELGKYELGYGILAPSLLAYYVFGGNGYNFKFGGGFGIRFVDVNILFPGTIEAINYSSIGYGFILRAEGNTLLGGNFYANIGGDIKYDVNGYPESGNADLDKQFNNVSLNSLAVGLRLGVSYIF